MIDQRPSKGGIFGAIILGIVGAVIGGFLASTFLNTDVTGINISSIIVAVAGALIALFAGRMFNKSA